MDRALQAKLEQDPLLRSATEWFFELRSNEVPVERIGEWQQWLAADARHRQAFDQVEAFWRTGSQAVTTQWPTDAEVAADTYDGDVSISEWRRTDGSHRHRQPRVRMALAAGVAVAAIVVGWVGIARWPQMRADLVSGPNILVTTTVGETLTLPLPDGSTVAVGGDTRLSANFDTSHRELTLERGEAFFHVAKDPARPFTVRAGGAAVTAIGTAFNVRKAGERVVVAVSEGSVRVAPASATRAQAQHDAQLARPAQLTAGQQLSVEPDGVPSQVSPVDTNAVAGWRQGRLHYVDEPLETILKDLARYSRRDIRIADAKVANLRVTGIVFEQNVDGWLASLQATFPVEVERSASGGVTLRGR